MNVKIIETKNGKLVGAIPIRLVGLNYTPSNQEYFDEAWQAAVTDRTVDPARREEYSFRLSPHG